MSTMTLEQELYRNFTKAKKTLEDLFSNLKVPPEIGHLINKTISAPQAEFSYDKGKELPEIIGYIIEHLDLEYKHNRGKIGISFFPKGSVLNELIEDLRNLSLKTGEKPSDLCKVNKNMSGPEIADLMSGLAN